MLDHDERDDKILSGDVDYKEQEDIFAEDEVIVPETDQETAPKQEEQRSVYSIKFERSGKKESTESQESYDPGNGPTRYSYMEEDEPEQADASGDKRRKRTARRRVYHGGGNPYVKAIGCAILCGVIIGGCILGSFALGKNVVANVAPIASNDEKLSSAADEETTLPAASASKGNIYIVSQIAQNCGTSVVAITNRGVSEVQTWFGTYQQETEGSGSGVIVSQSDSELLIVTNYHVIQGSKELTVCFNDSEDAIYSAQIKGTDESNDLAVVSVPLKSVDEEVLKSISVANLGDSESLQVGDQVVAVGNALGLGRSVTTGIISALNREVTIENTTYTLMQTDAAINPGNSGGALFNMKGELVGINSAKFASDQIEGMGFAIPMAKAEPIIENLMTRETRTKLDSNYGCLNISGTNVSDEASSLYGIPMGVYIAEVLDGGAAQKAGMVKGDVITSLDGTSISSIEQLKDQLQYYPAGETVEIKIQRNSGNGYEEQTLSVVLDNASEQDTSAFSNSNPQDVQEMPQNGFDGGMFGY